MGAAARESSTVIAPECSGAPPRSRPQGATPPAPGVRRALPSHPCRRPPPLRARDPPPAARRRARRRDRGAARSCARSSTGRRASRRPTARRSSSPGSPSATSRRPVPRASRMGLLTDAPAHLVADPGHRPRGRADGRGGAGPARSSSRHSSTAARSSPRTSTSWRITGRSSSARPGRPARRSASRPPSAAGSRSSGRSRGTSRPTGWARVRGIVNGTTNYILTAMAREGRAYGEVLAEAQRLGLRGGRPDRRRRGPRRGQQARRARPAGSGPGSTLQSCRIAPARRAGRDGAPGITGVTAQDVAALARRGPDPAPPRNGARGRPTARSRHPWCRPQSRPARRSGAATASSTGSRWTARRSGSVAFEGPGAGGAATASAVLGDLVAIARGLGSTWAGTTPAVDRSPLPVRPVASECVAAPSGACYPTAD